ncbi:MAG: hypothetical protein ACT4PL_11000 [Phycisphaerales bacterium]
MSTLLLAGAGCDPVKAPGSVQGDPLPATLYPKIAVLEGLQGFIVMGTEPRVNVGPPMGVTCALRAKTDFEELSVQYRYIFFTSAGVPLNNNPDWQYQRMQSRVESFFSGNALDRTAVDWRLEVRPAR